MKTLVLLFVLLLQSSVFGKELTVLIKEGWESKPLVGCEVTLKSNVGRVLEVKKTNSSGEVVFSNVSYGYVTVIAEDKSGNFESITYRFKITSNSQLTWILPPTRRFEEAQIAIEDSIYGTFDGKKKKSVDEEQLETADESQESNADTTSQEASFPGGMTALQKFINKNLFYPEISRELGDQGRVYVEFIVQPDGVLTHVKISRGVTKELDHEAKRLIRAMPNWKPGISRGKGVRTKCRLPLTFTLE